VRAQRQQGFSGVEVKVARGALKRAKAQLDNVKARIIGVVLNGLKAEISPDFEYHDKYYYYYGSEHKKKLTMEEKIGSWSEQVKKYVKDFPEKLKNFMKDKEKWKLNIDIRSGVFKIALLLLALALLITGLYYQRMINKPVQADKVQTGPAPIAPSEHKDKPSGEK